MTIRLIKYFIRMIYFIIDTSVVSIANASDGLQKDDSSTKLTGSSKKAFF